MVSNQGDRNQVVIRLMSAGASRGKGMEHVNVCDVNVSSVNLDSACRVIDQWIQEGHKTYVCVAPASTIVDCCCDEQYRRVVNEAGMVTPDGMPVVWAGKLKGGKHIARTYGPDLMLALCAFGEERGYRHFFYGGIPQNCDALEKRLKERFSSIKVAGRISPPYRNVGAMESNDVISQINAAKPDILWIGLGSPKQDFWMHQHRAQLDVPVMIGVGAAFDFLAGTKRQAPRWMRNSGLEWLFRLCCEPKRLWRRYLIGNAQFLYFLAKDFFSMHKVNKNRL